MIILPTREELGYNLNKLPKDEQAYLKAMKSLADSVIDYSKQIAALSAPAEHSSGGENA